MQLTLKQQISTFFRDIGPRNALVFTTFGLDEAALVRLLKKHEIPAKQRIVVYHEVMKHRNPGFLRVHFPNCKVVSVELTKKPKENVCPIFHSKIWMEVSKSPFRCMRLAVLSANITRYHLDESVESRTCESFNLWKATDIKLPKDPLFNRTSVFEGRGTSRIRISPATFVIDNRTNNIKISRKETSVYEILLPLLQENNEKLIACAAPFINKTPITRLGNIYHKISIRTGKKKDGSKLHAKILELKRHIVTGSPNITNQAYGLTDQGVVNHETVVISNKPSNFSIDRMLKGVTKIFYKDLDDDVREPFEDTDGLFDWIQQKKWAILGPDTVMLVLNEDTGRAELHLKGNMDGITKMTIHNYIDNKVSESLSECPLKKLLRFKKREQQQRLVEIVLSPPVFVKGLKGSKIIWLREVNLGEFWNWIEDNVVFLKLCSKIPNHGNDQKKTLSSRALIFDDVRELSLKAYFQKKLTTRVQLWHRWITKYGKYGAIGQGIPHWCIEMGKYLRRIERA